MAIAKLDFSRVKQSKKSFTSFLTQVIQNIPDAFCLGLYCYLSSLPPDWIVNRKHLQNYFGVGRDKVSYGLKWLKDHHLIAYVQEREADGTVGKMAIEVREGWEFIEKCVSTAPLKNRRAVKPDTGETAPTYKTTNTKKIKKQREPQPARAKRLPLSLDFTPDEHGKAICEKRNLDIETIVEKFKTISKRDGLKFEDEQAGFQLFALNERVTIDKISKTSRANVSNQSTFYQSDDEEYKQCSTCKRPKKHCECRRAMGKSESAKILEKLKVNRTNPN